MHSYIVELDFERARDGYSAFCATRVNNFPRVPSTVWKLERTVAFAETLLIQFS